MKGLCILSYIFIVTGCGITIFVMLNVLGLDMLREGPVTYGELMTPHLPLRR